MPVIHRNQLLARERIDVEASVVRIYRARAAADRKGRPVVAQDAVSVQVCAGDDVERRSRVDDDEGTQPNQPGSDHEPPRNARWRTSNGALPQSALTLVGTAGKLFAPRVSLLA